MKHTIIIILLLLVPQCYSTQEKTASYHDQLEKSEKIKLISPEIVKLCCLIQNIHDTVDNQQQMFEAFINYSQNLEQFYQQMFLQHLTHQTINEIKLRTQLESIKSQLESNSKLLAQYAINQENYTLEKNNLLNKINSYQKIVDEIKAQLTVQKPSNEQLSPPQKLIKKIISKPINPQEKLDKITHLLENLNPSSSH